MKRRIIFFVGFPFLLLLFGAFQHKYGHKYVKQGIRGCVYLIKGNQMPGPRSIVQSPRGISAAVYIFPLVNLSQAEQGKSASFYKAIHARPVKVAEADSTGYFEASLDTGVYSVFIKVGEYYYSGVRDQFDNLSPVKVYSSGQTYVELFYKSGVTY